VLPPPTGRFSWSARDNVNYTETGALAALDYAATNAHALLRNFYTKSLHSWRKGLDAPPYAFLIPEDQGDPARVADMVARHVVAFNFNPLYRDSNRGDQRMLWNAIINWQAILAPQLSPAMH
jgi:hypothetical protein